MVICNYCNFSKKNQICLAVVWTKYFITVIFIMQPNIDKITVMNYFGQKNALAKYFGYIKIWLLQLFPEPKVALGKDPLYVFG